MKAIVLLLLSIPLFANYNNQVSVLLDVGASSLTVHDSGPGGVDHPMQFAPPATRRVRFTVSPIYVPPAAGTTYSTCAAPCTVNTWRNWGQQYYWVEYVDSSGNPLSPRLFGQAGSSYLTNACGGLGTLPMVVPSITTTSPLPMPREIIGQDCYELHWRVALQSGHASTGIRRFLRVHSPAYNALLPNRVDGKMAFQNNSGAWQVATNTNTDLTAVDEIKYYVVTNSNVQKTIGGYSQVRDYMLAVPNGTIGGADTTVDSGAMFRGTGGITSGFRILEDWLIESTDKTVTQIVCTSNVCVGTSNSHGFSSGESILIRGAPGMRVLNGAQVLTSVTSNTFTFTPHATGSGGSKAPIYVATDGTYTVPVNRNPVTDPITEQPVMYASRMLVAATSVTYTDPSTWTAPGGGDATRGNCLITTGNSACTAGQFDQLVAPNNPYVNNTFHFSKCGSCHSPTLADLKYYNFSNESIEQRSIFHGFTLQEGLDIAAAVRGNAIAVPTQARPWNPPYQTGPGMSNGTFTKAGSTLTNIVVASNVATATVPAHGLKTGDPSIVSGATVDSDLNALYSITVTGVNTFTFPTVSVANGTYTESTLQITMANDAAAGCGIDCVTTYGYDDMLATMSPSSKSTWVWNSGLDPRNIAYPYQFWDWDRIWLPTIYPADVYSGADYLNSQPYTHFQTLLAGITKGSFASYKANGYTLTNGNTGLYQEAQTYASTDPDVAGYWTAPSLAPRYAPANQNYLREGPFKAAMVATWTLMTEYQLLGLYGQMNQDIHGSPTLTGCHPPWGIPGDLFFIVAPHVQKMWGENSTLPSGVLEGYASTWNTITNVAYVMTPSFNSNACYGTPQNNIDSQYTANWLDLTGQLRAGGYATYLINPILSPQAGRQKSDFIYHGSTALDGTDWTPVLRTDMFNPNKRWSYYWFTAGAWTTLVDDYLNLKLAVIAPYNTAAWQNMSLNTGYTTCAANGAYNVWNASSINPCDFAAAHVTYLTLFGANSTNRATFKAWAAAVWPLHDFDADEAAATQGDTGQYGTGDLSVAGAGKVITFTGTGCPINANLSGVVMNLVIGGGGGRSEHLPGSRITGGTCTAGGAGTIIVTTLYAHPAGWKLTYGCSTVNLEPNWSPSDDPDRTAWWQCSNMLP